MLEYTSALPPLQPIVLGRIVLGRRVLFGRVEVAKLEVPAPCGAPRIFEAPVDYTLGHVPAAAAVVALQ